MPPRNIADLHDLGADVLGTTIDAHGVVLAQTGDVLAGDVSSDGAEWWQHVGFASRPARAISGESAAQTITINQGSSDVCVASRDTRGSELVAGLGLGETALYARGPDNKGRGRIVLSDDGTDSTITITTETGNTAGGQIVEVKLLSSGAIQVNAAGVSLGVSPTEGVVLGGPAFQTWTAALATAVRAALNAIAVTPCVNGSPLNPAVAPLESGLDFPTAEISTSVKAAP